jgi:hypothetical protein
VTSTRFGEVCEEDENAGYINVKDRSVISVSARVWKKGIALGERKDSPRTLVVHSLRSSSDMQLRESDKLSASCPKGAVKTRTISVYASLAKHLRKGSGLTII